MLEESARAESAENTISSNRMRIEEQTSSGATVAHRYSLAVHELPCVCISLIRRKDRWKRFMDQTEVAKLPLLRRLDAVDGRTINVRADGRINPFTKKNILSKQRRSHEELDSPGGIGCALSHITAWKQLLEGDAQYLLVFEDDAVVFPGFVNLMNESFAKDPALAKPFDLLIFSNAKKYRNGHPSSTGDFSTVDSFVLATAYIISRRAAKLFINEAIPISHHIDFYMSVQSKLHELRMIGSPTLIIRQAGQRSDIQMKPTCQMCDVPTNFYEHSLIVPHHSWVLAKGSEYLLITVLIGYIAFRTLRTS